jgi:2-haloacid dehalogenase
LESAVETDFSSLHVVFGTCVNWRKSVISALHAYAHQALNDATKSLASRLRLRISEMTEEQWAQFAQEWRNSYKVFTKKLVDNPPQPWMSVDEHHLKALQELIVKWELEGLWDEDEVKTLSLVWHRLEPWEDSVKGVEMLNQQFATCTLSNGNMRYEALFASSSIDRVSRD